MSIAATKLLHLTPRDAPPPSSPPPPKPTPNADGTIDPAWIAVCIILPLGALAALLCLAGKKKETKTKLYQVRYDTNYDNRVWLEPLSDCARSSSSSSGTSNAATSSSSSSSASSSGERVVPQQYGPYWYCNRQ
ncbi:hypothetical protein B0T19DRAFT_402237 [Cercophora scortea]|uniref:Uncharacterized protein n=1 Tax=Cercophora scortea TaxID=314031 RepID=A0AAE0IFC3_9PEZI|nr:hypothetical protein B0T19DRAFT_402237 [Cercophora scortea]